MFVIQIFQRFCFYKPFFSVLFGVRLFTEMDIFLLYNVNVVQKINTLFLTQERQSSGSLELNLHTRRGKIGSLLLRNLTVWNHRGITCTARKPVIQPTLGSPPSGSRYRGSSLLWEDPCCPEQKALLNTVTLTHTNCYFSWHHFTVRVCWRYQYS